MAHRSWVRPALCSRGVALPRVHRNIDPHPPSNPELRSGYQAPPAPLDFELATDDTAEMRVRAATHASAIDPLAFRAYVEHAPDGFVVVDRPTSRILDLNQAACDFAGADRHALIGGPIARLVPGWQETEVWQAFLHGHLPGTATGEEHAWGDAQQLDAFAATGESPDYRFRRDHATGDRTLPRFYDVIPRRFPSEQLDHVVLTVRDVTALVDTEAERVRIGQDLLRIVQMLPDVVFSCERRDDGKIYWTLNEGRLADEFGLTTKEIEGKSLEELFPGGASAAIKAHFEAAFDGVTTEFINEMGGRHFKHYPQPIYGPDGNVAHVVGFISEVTNLVEAEERIRGLNKALENRVEELAQANRDLEAYSYTVSHDLGTPLAVIDTLAQGIARTPANETGDLDRYTNKIRTSVDRMQRLIDDVLTMSRATRTEVKPKTCDLRPMVESCLEELRLRDPDRQVSLDMPDTLPAYADPGLARIVIDNLVRNAWKYTGKEPVATLKIYMEPERADLAGRLEPGPVFVLSDNGVGFDAKDAPRLFEAFGRAGTSEGFEGAGVGLATVSRIIQRHGGKVWAEGRPGEGATFCFTFARPPVKPSEDA